MGLILIENRQPGGKRGRFAFVKKRTLEFLIQTAPDSAFEMDTETATESGHRNRRNVITVVGLPLSLLQT